MEKKKVKTKLSFEDALRELEEIASRLEHGSLGLDESISEFERGVALTKFCHQKLEEAEKKIAILQKNENGEIHLKTVNVSEDGGEIEDDEDMQGTLL